MELEHIEQKSNNIEFIQSPKSGKDSYNGAVAARSKVSARRLKHSLCQKQQVS